MTDATDSVPRDLYSVHLSPHGDICRSLAIKVCLMEELISESPWILDLKFLEFDLKLFQSNYLLCSLSSSSNQWMLDMPDMKTGPIEIRLHSIFLRACKISLAWLCLPAPPQMLSSVLYDVPAGNNWIQIENWLLLGTGLSDDSCILSSSLSQHILLALPSRYFPDPTASFYITALMWVKLLVSFSWTSAVALLSMFSSYSLIFHSVEQAIF